MFIDQVSLKVQSGNGGNGIIAFRREKHVPLGGPSGGDGGRGGNVIFEADEGLSTLFDLRYQKSIKARSGEDGKNKNMRGADAEDVVVKVPVGTIIYECDTNRIIADLTKHQERALIAKGGRGGRGNQQFATSRNKAPRIQENGERGETLDLRIELKLLADVGVIGFPSVGKSTFINAITNAKAKTGDFPFTTITPNLGVVAFPSLPPFVIADMPGIIEGASQGSGLGLQFLKHIERTRVLIHMIDVSSSSSRDPVEDYHAINKELLAYQYQLSLRPQIIVANKIDEPGSEHNLEKLRQALPTDTPIFAISALQRTNLKDLIHYTYEVLAKTPMFPLHDELKIEHHITYDFHSDKPEFIIERISTHVFEVRGSYIDQMYDRASLNSDEALTRFLRQLRQAGLDHQLREKGAQHQDLIKIHNLEFDFVDE